MASSRNHVRSRTSRARRIVTESATEAKSTESSVLDVQLVTPPGNVSDASCDETTAEDTSSTAAQSDENERFSNIPQQVKDEWDKFFASKTPEDVVPNIRLILPHTAYNVHRCNELKGSTSGPLWLIAKEIRSLYHRSRDFTTSRLKTEAKRQLVKKFFEDGPSIVSAQDRLRAVAAQENERQLNGEDHDDLILPINRHERARIFLVLAEQGNERVRSLVEMYLQKSEGREQIDAPRSHGGGSITFKEAVYEPWRNEFLQLEQPACLEMDGHILTTKGQDPPTDLHPNSQLHIYKNRPLQQLITAYNATRSAFSAAKSRYERSGEGDSAGDLWKFCNNDPVVLMIWEMYRSGDDNPAVAGFGREEEGGIDPPVGGKDVSFEDLSSPPSTSRKRKAKALEESTKIKNEYMQAKLQFWKSLGSHSDPHNADRKNCKDGTAETKREKRIARCRQRLSLVRETIKSMQDLNLPVTEDAQHQLTQAHRDMLRITRQMREKDMILDLSSSSDDDE